ncbi:U4/U6 small nuclear ribonucleoprotein Prp3-like [Panonychus citri]|uniref:U4/U6 small nuclear ribonucleoprotein Prp3-like n=1 Tax=Panonychus citri TaxID=50023 RepID=UPI002307E5EE|nr:U4/U6 small nuclear ribonucleoprotein Prp3-like [Panonychus citri]
MGTPIVPAKLNSLQIKEMMENAQRQIEMKKKQIAEKQRLLAAQASNGANSVPSTSSSNNPPSLTPAELTRAQIQARLEMATAELRRNPALALSLSNRAATASTSSNDSSKQNSKPAPLILDHEGRTVDSSGREVTLVQRLPTLKANIRAQKREQFKVTNQEKPTNDDVQSKFFDPRVEVKPVTRVKRNFKFYDKGTFEIVGEKVRTKAKLESLQKQIAQAAVKTGISSAARLAVLSSIVPKKEIKEDDIPDVEWWDSFVITDNSYEESVNCDKPLEEKYEGITHLIEHPMQIKPLGATDKPMALPVFLTKAEHKKLRRQNRRETWKEKQEKIRLGLEPPPEPKVKMSNMMRVLGDQAIKDPTKVESQVKESMAKRQKTHEEANASRKLTADQKKQKKIKKVKEDTSLGVHVTVYRILNFSDPKRKFKVETNAKQLQMTGIVVTFKNVNVVIVEGGPKQQIKFEKLMMRRIDWNEDTGFKDKYVTGEKVENKCFLVWKGLAKNRAFNDFRFKNAPNESYARELLKNHHVEHYWDLAYSLSILDN